MLSSKSNSPNLDYSLPPPVEAELPDGELQGKIVDSTAIIENRESGDLDNWVPSIFD